MTVPPGKPAMCPTLVGRDAHLEGLERALDGVSSGRGETVLIAGEAGIGKSRLASEVRSRAVRRGYLTLEGHCFEPDRVLPYAPILDLLRTRLADQSSDRIAREWGASAPELIKLLPELATLLPGLAPTPALEPEHEKRRLFHALTQWFAGLAAMQPLLVIFEDLHWSDDTSLDFVLFFAHRIATRSVLLLCTYRSDETHPTLGHFLAEVDRRRLATELPLPRLGKADVDVMVQVICGPQRPVGTQLVNTVYTLTDGNPFFIEEVLRSLIATHAPCDAERVGELPIPRSVHDSVQRRIAPLRPAARETLRLAAVAGRRFNLVLLQALTRQDERALLETIKELIAAQLVIEESAEHFAFRHALTRQAIYAQLLTRERKALHQSIAETMERVYVDAIDRHRADLANHFFEAEVWSKALEHAQRAGEQAQALYAPRAAIEHFTRALDAASHLPIAAPVTLYRARAQAYKTLGAFERARADHEAALSGARSAKDQHAEWQALLDLGLLWASRDYARTGAYYRDSQRQIGPPHLMRLRADALTALGRVAEAESLLQADVAAARARGCLPPLWRLHVALGRLYRADGRRAEAERELAAARSVIEQLAANVPEVRVPALTGSSLRDQFLRSALLPQATPLPPGQGAARVPGGLTSREVDVLRLLAAGWSNREIAGELVISVRTVEHHITSIYDKIGTRRRAAATTYALRHGLIPNEPDR